nr:ssrA-binding protein-like [Nerophis lumbriciformis]
MATDKHPEVQQLASNKRARHEYHILDRLEAGMVLTGTEVKSARQGNVQLKESHVELRNGQAWLIGAHFSPYSHGNYNNHNPERERKLLLNKREIERLDGKSQGSGMTVVPLKMYRKGNRIKLEIALAQGKKLYDKRETERRRELDREAHEAMKNAGRVVD